MAHIRDLMGQRFGRLVVVSFGERFRNRTTWVCRCDCGESTTVLSMNLVQGRTTSCKCKYRERSGSQNYGWKGCGDITGHYWGVVRKGAELRKMDFSITIEHAWSIYLLQNRRCALSGIELTFGARPTVRSKAIPQTASLDRIDSKSGYIIGNVQWLHKKVQTMKWDLGQEEFIRWCQQIGSYSSSLRNDVIIAAAAS